RCSATSSANRAARTESAGSAGRPAGTPGGNTAAPDRRQSRHAHDHSRAGRHHGPTGGRDRQRGEQRHARRRWRRRRDPPRGRTSGPRRLHRTLPERAGDGRCGVDHTAGELPARWVIHTVGPNVHVGERDPATLESCYRRSLAVADELGARTVAFPMISTGAYGWPIRDAALTAAFTIASTPTHVRHVRLVAFDDEALRTVEFAVLLLTPLRILQAVRVLHRRGAQHARIRPGMS